MKTTIKALLVALAIVLFGASVMSASAAPTRPMSVSPIGTMTVPPKCHFWGSIYSGSTRAAQIQYNGYFYGCQYTNPWMAPNSPTLTTYIYDDGAGLNYGARTVPSGYHKTSATLARTIACIPWRWYTMTVILSGYIGTYSFDRVDLRVQCQPGNPYAIN